jgi:hypothetical protein
MNASANSESLDAIRLGVERLRGDPSVPPRASIVVPVNAQGDLELVVALVGDLVSYDGPHTFEIVLLVNNFPPEGPPPEIEALERLGLRVESVPDVWRRGEAVCFSARMVGIKAAASEHVVSFDADSRSGPSAPGSRLTTRPAGSSECRFASRRHAGATTRSTGGLSGRCTNENSSPTTLTWGRCSSLPVATSSTRGLARSRCSPRDGGSREAG